MDVKAEILKEKLVIIARSIPVETLKYAAEALCRAGVRLLETTFDHLKSDPIADNVEKISMLQKTFGNRMLIGAGTVLTEDEAQAAFDSGAKFIISPNTNTRVVERTQKLGMVSVPGAVTPTEICTAWGMGADIVKLFPADDVGYHYIQNIRGPLPHIPLMVTGGVNPVSIQKFLQLGVHAFGTGITVLRRDLLDAKDFQGIETLARMHIDAIRLR